MGDGSLGAATADRNRSGGRVTLAAAVAMRAMETAATVVALGGGGGSGGDGGGTECTVAAM